MKYELMELQHWSDANVNMVLYYNPEYEDGGDIKRFHIRDFRDSKNNCSFNSIEYAVKYIETIIRMKKKEG